MLLSAVPASANSSITVSNADKVYAFTMARNSSMLSAVAATQPSLIVEGAKILNSRLTGLPAAAGTTTVTLPTRLFVEGAMLQSARLSFFDTSLLPITAVLPQRLFVESGTFFHAPLVNIPTTLQLIGSAISDRLIVYGSDIQLIPSLVRPNATLVPPATNNLLELETTPTGTP